MKATIEGWVARVVSIFRKRKVLKFDAYLRREENGELILSSLPERYDWTEKITLAEYCFPSVKWEDSEPTKCKLTIEI